MKLIRQIAISFTGIVGLCSCATIINNYPQEVTIDTDSEQPVAIQVSQNNDKLYTGNTPTKLKIKPASHKALNVRVIDPCYKSNAITVEESVKPIFWLNALNWGVGAIVDYSTGSMWRYESDVLLSAEHQDNLSETCQTRLLKNLEQPKILHDKTKTDDSPHLYGFGFVISEVSNRRNYIGNGQYFYYNFEKSPEIDYQFRLTNVDRDCYSGHFDFRRKSGCINGLDVNSEQASYTFSINYHPKNHRNWIFGLGTGIVDVRVDGYSRSIENSRRFESFFADVVAIPVFVDLGLQLGSSFKVKTFGSIPLSKFGFGRSAIIHSRDNVSDLSDPEVRKQARLLVLQSVEYSMIGVGLEWKPKGELGYAISAVVGLSVFFGMHTGS